VVVNFAAETHVDRSIEGPDIFIKTNVFGTFNLLRTSLEYFHSLPKFSKDDSITSQNKFRFLQISTDEVYGSLKEDDSQFKEQDPYKPNSPYSASKASGDHFVRAWTKTYGLPAIVTNCSNNYGPFQYPEKLIPLTIQNCLSGKKIPIYGKGDQIRDWLFVDDHCSALEKIISKGRLGENYNIGGECEYRNIDLVKLICSTLDGMDIKKHPSVKKGYEELISFVPDRMGHDYRYGVNIKKIKNDLNWQPSISIEEGIKRTVLWYLENTKWLNNLEIS
jgi:dTDP-glucose 4,6-dehydratase